MKWDGNKFKIDYQDENWPLEKYYFILEKINKDNKVLDIACGLGFGSFLLAQKAKEVVGMDIDLPSIEYANKNFKKNNLTYRLGDAKKIDFPDNSFDLISSIETIEHLNEADQKKFISEIKRVLKPGGIFILSTPDTYVAAKQGIYYGDFHEKEFTKNDFVNFLNSGNFGNLEIYGQGKFSEPTLIRKFLNAIKRLDVINLRKIFITNNFIKKIDQATSPVLADYKVYKMSDSKDLAAHIIAVGNNFKI